MSATSGTIPEPSRGVELQLDTLIAGLQGAMAKGLTSLNVKGSPKPIADLLSSAQQTVKPWKDIRVARGVIHTAVKSKPQAVLATRALREDVKASLVSLYGADSQELVPFGFKPKKPPQKRTGRTNVLSAAKGQLTRELRNTQGQRQKARVRNVGTPVVTIGPDGMLIAPPASVPVSKPNGAAKP